MGGLADGVFGDALLHAGFTHPDTLRVCWGAGRPATFGLQPQLFFSSDSLRVHRCLLLLRFVTLEEGGGSGTDRTRQLWSECCPRRLQAAPGVGLVVQVDLLAAEVLLNNLCVLHHVLADPYLLL